MAEARGTDPFAETDDQAALRELAREPGVTVFSAHDPSELERLRAGAREACA